MVTIDHTLENGDIIEIVTSAQSGGPSIDWLKIAKSSTARTKIRQWLKKENKSDEIDKGKVLLDKYVRKKGYDPKMVIRNSFLNKLIKELNFKDFDEFYTQIANGGTVLSKAAGKLFSLYNEHEEYEKRKDENTAETLGMQDNSKLIQHRTKSEQGIIVKGMEGLLVRVSKCCNPVPGDDIIGYITKGRGISVHRKDCPNMISLPEEEKKRFIEVEWNYDHGQSYEADITIVGEDRKGLFSDLSKICDNMNAHITGVNAKMGKMPDNLVKVLLTIAITNTGQIGKIIQALKGIPGIYEVYRSKV